jgi:hypothetical protein
VELVVEGTQRVVEYRGSPNVECSSAASTIFFSAPDSRRIYLVTGLVSTA